MLLISNAYTQFTCSVNILYRPFLQIMHNEQLHKDIGSSTAVRDTVGSGNPLHKAFLTGHDLQGYISSVLAFKRRVGGGNSVLGGEGEHHISSSFFWRGRINFTFNF